MGLVGILFYALSSADYRVDRYNHASTCEPRLFAEASSQSEILTPHLHQISFPTPDSCRNHTLFKVLP